MKKIELSKDELNIILKMYNDELLGSHTISEKTGISKPTILRMLKENGVIMGPSGRKNIGGKQVADKRWREKNKDSVREYVKTWNEKNKEHRKEYLKEYREKNIENIRKTKRDYERNRKESDPLYKLISNFRTAIYQVLKESNVEKNKHYFDILQYTPESLIKHLESQFENNMNWDNYGEWHVDHKLPITSFNIEEMGDEEFMRCWSLDNLQPMWGNDNIRKSNKIIGTE
jgi:predicted DNA-binding transcriptional regulator AlpA